jgi:hypothetical protein
MIQLTSTLNSFVRPRKEGDIVFLDFNVNLLQRTYKQVVVDGETYVKNGTEEVNYTSEMSRNGDESRFNRLLDYGVEGLFDLKLEKHYSVNMDYLKSFIDRTIYSSVDYVSWASVLFNLGFFPKIIKGVYNGKNEEQSFYKNNINCVVHGYGFQNLLFYKIHIKDFLLLPLEVKKSFFNYDSIERQVYKKFSININQDLDVKMALEMFKKVISNKEYKR